MTATRTLAKLEREEHRRLEAIEHPVVEVLKHAASPLSVALYVYVAGRYYLRKPITAAVKAKAVVLRRSLRNRFGNRPSSASLAAPIVPATTTAAAASTPPSTPPLNDQFIRGPQVEAFDFQSHVSTPDLDVLPIANGGHHHDLLSEIFPVEKTVEGLHLLHDATGLPWWGTIAVGTLMLRSVLTPFNISLLRNSLRMKLIKSETEKAAAEMELAKTTAEKEKAADGLLARFEQAKANPFGNLSVPLLFPPIVLTVFGAVHHLCLFEPQMATEGLLWFPDLMATDPTFVLPALSGLTWLWNVEIAVGAMYASSFKLRAASRAVAVAMIPVASTLPCGVFVFWLTSNAWEITRIHILRRDRVRKLLGIPLQSELPVVPRDHI